MLTEQVLEPNIFLIKYSFWVLFNFSCCAFPLTNYYKTDHLILLFLIIFSISSYFMCFITIL